MDRFWDKVYKTDSCWNWKASIRGKYGAYRDGHKKKIVLAHRFSYENNIGLIPQGMLVCHTCDNMLCVNPEHLFLGSYRDNNQDAIKKGRNPVYNNRSLDDKTVENLKKALNDRSNTTIKQISKEFKISYSITKRINRGETYRS